ncbi:MAG: antitoxin [Armatimonadetes bacterium]|nr:antitoxin [Armatimonadota bacterium]
MRKAKLFKNGQSQAVRLPRDFRFPGTEVHIKKVGNAVVLLPVEGFWEPLLESLDSFTDDFMESREQPGAQEREDLFD